MKRYKLPTFFVVVALVNSLVQKPDKRNEYSKWCSFCRIFFPILNFKLQLNEMKLIQKLNFNKQQFLYIEHWSVATALSLFGLSSFNQKCEIWRVYIKIHSLILCWWDAGVRMLCAIGCTSMTNYKKEKKKKHKQKERKYYIKIKLFPILVYILNFYW